MEKNSQKKGSLPKGGEPNGGVKKALQKGSLPIACREVVSDSKQLELFPCGYVIIKVDEMF